MTRMPIDGYEAALMVLAGIAPDKTWMQAQELAHGGPVVHLVERNETTCCAQTPYCLPAWHRLTLDPALANCKGR